MILATHIRPFDAKQVVYVLTDKYDVEESQTCDLSKLTDTVMELLSNPYYNFNKVEFHGPKQLCIKEKDKIENTAYFSKYCNNKIKIEISAD